MLLGLCKATEFGANSLSSLDKKSKHWLKPARSDGSHRTAPPRHCPRLWPLFLNGGELFWPNQPVSDFCRGAY